MKFGNLFPFSSRVIGCFSGDTATESQSISIAVSPKQLDSQNACYIDFLEIHYPPFLFSPTTPSDSAWRTTTEGTYHDSITNSLGRQILTHSVVGPATTQSRPTCLLAAFSNYPPKCISKSSNTSIVSHRHFLASPAKPSIRSTKSFTESSVSIQLCFAHVHPVGI